MVASYVESSQEITRAGVERTVWNKGYLVQATYVLTGEASTLRGVTPAKVFNLGGDGWGAFEVAARISALTVGSNAFTGTPGTELANAASSARRATGYTGGLNWYLNRNVKAVLNYEFTDFEGGGNGAAGPGAVTADDEHAVFARAQVSF